MKNKINRGFSLVELIVVIAVMGVLMIVLAPTYYRYVEKTRIQKDVTAVAEVIEMLKVSGAEEEISSGLSMVSSKPTLVVIDDGVYGEDTTITVSCEDSSVETELLLKELTETIGILDFTSSEMDGKTVVVSVYEDATKKLVFCATADGTNISNETSAYKELSQLK